MMCSFIIPFASFLLLYHGCLTLLHRSLCYIDSAVGILRVHVLKATNVDVANIAGGGAIANLYVVLGMGEQQHFRSKVL